MARATKPKKIKAALRAAFIFLGLVVMAITIFRLQKNQVANKNYPHLKDTPFKRLP